MEFLKKLKISILNLSEISVKIIKYGLAFAVSVCALGMAIYIMNRQLFIFNYLGEAFGVHIMLAGVGLVVQFVIGALIIDVIQKRRNGN